MALATRCAAAEDAMPTEMSSKSAVEVKSRGMPRPKMAGWFSPTSLRTTHGPVTTFGITFSLLLRSSSLMPSRNRCSNLSAAFGFWLSGGTAHTPTTIRGTSRKFSTRSLRFSPSRRNRCTVFAASHCETTGISALDWKRSTTRSSARDGPEVCFTLSWRYIGPRTAKPAASMVSQEFLRPPICELMPQGPVPPPTKVLARWRILFGSFSHVVRKPSSSSSSKQE
mmetsp:Transcript_102810/g.286354  ORF Transcript_102810/g.286354 Transcript_102810/m.286354 type:complete len:225 (+) Transcript_102810:318-992(+)